MASVFAIRQRTVEYLQKAAEHDTKSFVHVCQSIYQAIMMSQNPCPSWCRVRGKRGLYVVCPNPPGADPDIQSGIPVVEPGAYPVELDMCVLELRVAGTCPRGLDDAIARDEDVRFLLGSKTKVVVCMCV